MANIKNMRFSLWLLGIIIFTLSGCEKLFIKPDKENTHISNFEILWNDFDKNYSFFEYKRINWDSLYSVYRPLVHNEMKNRDFFKVLNQLLFHLKDGHVNLSAPFDYTRFSEYYLKAPPNFNYDLLERNYFNNQQMYTKGGAYEYIWLGNIGYIRISDFDASGFGYIEGLLTYFSNAKGIIIDIRNNPGGDPYNAEIVASHFNNVKRVYAFWKWKNGPKHSDFTDAFPYYIEASENPWLKPVALLTNRSSFSASNDFTLMMHQLPHVIHLGDTTGGGGGVPYYRELPNGWTYRFSRTQTLSPEGENVEFGISPHVLQYTDTNDFINGKDSMIEKALEILDN
ncbi:MAG: S41 family peptidase [Flavobacteriales bacterium]|nr:S41 family peptidase [Flavobacteriales bacterium]